MSSRRTFMQTLIAAGATLAGASRLLGQDPPRGTGGRRVAPANASHRLEDAMPARVVTPDVKDLPFSPLIRRNLPIGMHIPLAQHEY